MSNLKIFIMERIDFIKEAVFLSGLSIEEVIQAFASDVSIEFLQELVQSQKEKLATYQQTTALSESERLVESPQVLDDKTEKQYELFTAESGKVQIGMFYYNEDKTFSRELIDGKQVSGVVGYVDESKKHGLIITLRQKKLYWSLCFLYVNMPNNLSGKENTRLILKAAKKQGKIAEAAEYCANYAYDGIKAGEAFLPSKAEFVKIMDNLEDIKSSLEKIKDTQIKRDYYWTSSEYNSHKAYPINCFDNSDLTRSLDGIDGKDIQRNYVRPMIAF